MWVGTQENEAVEFNATVRLTGLRRNDTADTQQMVDMAGGRSGGGRIS